jgi:hypothetical protein
MNGAVSHLEEILMATPGNFPATEANSEDPAS